MAGREGTFFGLACDSVPRRVEACRIAHVSCRAWHGLRSSLLAVESREAHIARGLTFDALELAICAQIARLYVGRRRDGAGQAWRRLQRANGACGAGRANDAVTLEVAQVADIGEHRLVGMRAAWTRLGR